LKEDTGDPPPSGQGRTEEDRQARRRRRIPLDPGDSSLTPFFDPLTLIPVSSSGDRKYDIENICLVYHIDWVTWSIGLHDDFVVEYEELPEAVQDELLAMMGLLEEFGPQLGRPHFDTLKGSRHANTKELRFNAGDGVWRFLFAFDPNRAAGYHLRRRQIGLKRKAFLSAR
jgi:hypothetical protein